MPLLTLVACAGAPPVTAPVHRASDVAEAALLPTGFENGEKLRASCSRVTLRQGGVARLADVDCSFDRLTRVLKAQAGEQSAELIVGKRCHASAGGRSLWCSANVARAGRTLSFAAREAAADTSPAPSPAQVLDLDEPRPQDASQIELGFAPDPDAPERALAARSYANVAETQLPTVGLRALGEITASCEACDSGALHHALRVGAGHVGAGELSRVRCFREDDRSVCVGSALVPWSS